MVWIFVPELFGIGIIMIAGGVAVASLGNAKNNKKSREQVLTQAKLEFERQKGR